MRFGKTFTTYQLAKEMGWTRILVLTYKPAVEGAWREDLSHIDFPGWRFKGKRTRRRTLTTKRRWFGLPRSKTYLARTGAGNQRRRTRTSTWSTGTPLSSTNITSAPGGTLHDRSTWAKRRGGSKVTSPRRSPDTPDLDDDFVQDIEGALDLDVANYLYLSGTPFRALTEGEFLEDQVFNWTYCDEQRAKRDWKDRAQIRTFAAQDAPTGL